MAFSAFDADLDIISKLDDEPNDVGGLSSAALKAKFDEAGNIIKRFINKTLIPEVESAVDAAAQGISTGNNISGEKLADNSIGTEKLVDESVTASKIAKDAVNSETIADGAITRAKLAEDAINVQTEDLPNDVITSRTIASKAITSTKLADSAVQTGNIADEAVTLGKLSSEAKSRAVTASLTTAGWSSKKQTVSVSGVTADNNVLVAPAPASRTVWNDAEIYCSAQAAGTLTFTCVTVPTAAVTANIIILA